jgi:AcrR family transcriptional regulator
MAENLLAADGRVIGSRAQATRRRLLDATTKLLRTHGVLELKVVDITREAGTSPATFYQYFADVDAVLLALAEAAGENEQALLGLLASDWDGADGAARARAFVDAYMGYWLDHQAVLRIRNLKAEEGNRDFRRARTRAALPLIEAVAAMVERGQSAGRLDESLDPFATAAAMLAMMERLLAYQKELGQRGTSREALRQTLAGIMVQVLAGPVLEPVED